MLIIKYLNMDQLVKGEMVHGEGGGGPSWLLKLRQMGTQRVQMGKVSFLGWFVRLVVPVQ
jgi:hypothetical protein